MPWEPHTVTVGGASKFANVKVLGGVPVKMELEAWDAEFKRPAEVVIPGYGSFWAGRPEGRHEHVTVPLIAGPVEERVSDDGGAKPKGKSSRSKRG